MKFPQILFTFEKVIRVQRDVLPVYKASVWGSISELYPRKSETQKTSGNMCSRLFVDVL